MHYVFFAQSQTAKTNPLQSALSMKEKEVTVVKNEPPLVEPFSLSVTESWHLLNTALRAKICIFLPPTLFALDV